MQLLVRVFAWCAGVLVSLMVASVVFVGGWELPPRFECGGGDSCVAEHWYDIDWEIVNWELKPTRIACFEPNPGRSSVIVGPGEVCVSASGEREVRVTYEEMREATQRRRLATVAIVAGVLAVTPGEAVLLLRRPADGVRAILSVVSRPSCRELASPPRESGRSTRVRMGIDLGKCMAAAAGRLGRPRGAAAEMG